MAATENHTCHNCNVVLQEIKLIDKANMGIHTALEYTLPEAKRGFWTGGYPVEGRVSAFMCPTCGRISLYGVTRQE